MVRFIKWENMDNFYKWRQKMHSFHQVENIFVPDVSRYGHSDLNWKGDGVWGPTKTWPAVGERLDEKVCHKALNCQWIMNLCSWLEEWLDWPTCGLAPKWIKIRCYLFLFLLWMENGLITLSIFWNFLINYADVIIRHDIFVL